MNRLIAAIDRLRDWHVGHALPLWARAGVDATGAFHETLEFDGGPSAGQIRRVRVQSRQVHTFTDAARRGWLADGERIAAAGFARLVETACPDLAARGCVHRLDAAGRIIDNKRDLYDQAFLLLAAAARISAAKDAAALEIAERTLRFIDAELASPHGGYLESDQRDLPRRQNPHMHLFEALMALYAATRDHSCLVRLRAIERLFAERFHDAEAGVVREFFTDDWSLDPASGDIVEPGHLMEWVFLLDRFEALTGETRAETKRALYRTARAISPQHAAPFLPNSVRFRDGFSDGTRRLWPQTEALRAAFILARDGDAAAAEDAVALIDALFETYLAVEPAGLWRDEYDAAGRVIAANVPASILYHLHEAVSCAAECRHKFVP